jgi:hypothetical protein
MPRATYFLEKGKPDIYFVQSNRNLKFKIFKNLKFKIFKKFQNVKNFKKNSQDFKIFKKFQKFQFS